MKRKLFCEINPTCYKISLFKECLLRDVRDFFNHVPFASKKSTEILPNIVKGHCSILRRKLVGVDMQLQENKVVNLALACKQINGLIIEPNEIFSFWKTVGKPTAKKGYLDGLMIGKDTMKAGIGGGLCQMANMIHWLVLNSPCSVVELHHHSDALFPDERRGVPFGTGTSIVYKNVDYRFQNTTDQPLQLLVWIENDELYGELRSLRPFPVRYKLVEENHHFEKINDQYYRNSEVYRLTYDRNTNELIKKERILVNHSLVMYDPALIPPDQIRGNQHD